MSYTVKEMFYTLQGEGARSGRAAVFCRFAGCNLWSGNEDDRHNAMCRFCDTDFVGTDGVGGGRFVSAEALARAIEAIWPPNESGRARRYVVLTGGEPLLQVDDALVGALHSAGFEIAIESNGTQIPPLSIDWICVSPKAGVCCVLQRGHELKLVFPQNGAEPERFEALDFENFFCSRWMALTVSETRNSRCSTASSTPSGGSVYRPISISVSREHRRLMMALKWDTIRTEHVARACELVAADKQTLRGRTTRIVLAFRGQRLPAKEVLRTAYLLANRLPLDAPLRFASGESTVQRLRRLGFAVERVSSETHVAPARSEND